MCGIDSKKGLIRIFLYRINYKLLLNIFNLNCFQENLTEFNSTLINLKINIRPNVEYVKQKYEKQHKCPP